MPESYQGCMLHNVGEAHDGICLRNMGPSHPEKQTKKQLEMVQRKAARHVVGDYKTTSSVTNIMKNLEWPALEDRRKRAKVTMFYRIINGLIEVETGGLAPKTNSLRTRGHEHRYNVPFSRLQSHQQSFFPSTIRVWNNLPENVVAATNVNVFKDNLLQCFDL